MSDIDHPSHYNQGVIEVEQYELFRAALIAGLGSAELEFLPVDTLFKILDDAGLERRLLIALVRVASSPAEGLLAPRFRYIRDDDEFVNVSIGDVLDALENGGLMLPDGDVAEDWAEHTIVYFIGRAPLRKIIDAGGGT